MIDILFSRMSRIGKSLKEYEVEDWLLFLYGMIGTMPLLGIGNQSFFPYLTLLVLAYNSLYLLTVKRGNLSLNRFCIPLIVITAFEIISDLICITGPIKDLWKDGVSSKIVWSIAYLMVFFAYSEQDRSEKRRSYLQGVYAGAVFQMFWAWGQFFLYQSKGLSLNRVVFQNLFEQMGRDVLYDEYRSGLCLTGVYHHASNMAVLLTFGYVVSNSNILKTLFVIIAFICGSRTATIGIIICVLFDIVKVIKVHKKAVWNRHSFFLVVAFLGLGMLFLISSGIGSAIKQKVLEMYVSYSESIRMDTSDNALGHIYYWRSILSIMSRIPLLNVLFGFGGGCSGFAISEVMGVMYIGSKWVVECEYVDVLWSYGLIGVLCRFGWYICTLVRNCRVDWQYIKIFFGIAVMGITYNTSYPWALITVYFLFLLMEQGERLLSFGEGGE